MTHHSTTATESVAGSSTDLETPAETRTAPIRVTTSERRPGSLLPNSISLETACYGLIFVLAILTRFWDLGSRALHHDESLHSYYSWVFAQGGGYRHDPLMHGPFLFHANALAYLLFGTTDYVSRLMPAVAGVIIVMLPWLLRGRNRLGKWGALVASALLLISPSILYYSRFIRHDVYCLLGTFVLAIAILRYLERPQARWAITGGIAIGFLFCTKEVSFIVIFIFVTFLGLAIAWRSAKSIIAIGVLALVAFFAADKALHSYGVKPLPGIPWDNPTNQQVSNFTGQLISNPIILAAIGIGLLAIVLAILVLDRKRRRGYWIDGILGDAPEGSSSAALAELLWERRGLLIGIACALGIFVVFYTTFFSNMRGIVTGSVGALGYWLGQQDVQRGAQPWFYYLLLVPQYEFIGVLCLPPATIWVLWRWFSGKFQHRSQDRRLFLRGFLIYWALLMLAVLSWAGEKMPWLTIHIALPLTLLAASIIGGCIEWLEAHRTETARWVRQQGVAFGLAAAGLGIAGFLILAWASAGPFKTTQSGAGLALRSWASQHWAFVYLPWIVLILLIAAAQIRLGAKRALSILAIAGTLVLGAGEVHAGWRFTYRQGDVPYDMLLYVQTSPYVPTLSRNLQKLSQLTTGGMGLSIWFDGATQWPFNYYLRNFPNRVLFGDTLPGPPTAGVILLSQDYDKASIDNQLAANYTMFEYPMRWWYPEEVTYRRFAYAPELNDPSRQNYQNSQKGPYTVGDVLGSVVNSVSSMGQPSEQGKVFREVTYRQLPSTVGVYWFKVFIRNDLLPTWYRVSYDQ